MTRHIAALASTLALLTILACVAGCSTNAGPAVAETVSVLSQAEDEPELAGETVAEETIDNPAITIGSAELDNLAGRWGVDRIGVVEAWSAISSTEPVLVALLDTGIDPAAPYGDRIAGAIDFSGEGTVRDEHGHGTHMAGTIAAIAPEARLLNVKVADKRGRCETDDVAKAIRWAADSGAQVINVSLEVPSSGELENAVDYAWEHGAIVIAAAGNSGTDTPAYPAAYASSLAVAGTNQADGLAVLSNHGSWVDISAPGYRIFAEQPGAEFGYETGTSPAAAHVSGVAALLFGLATDDSGNGLVNDEVRTSLTSTAEKIAATGTGSGIVDASAAVRMIVD
ncbi:MAG: S8 family serine peptidase [Dehalococcoidia bacterium]|nr:S8 family serine peptidase [Dehalococcoidia bacterium]